MSLKDWSFSVEWYYVALVFEFSSATLIPILLIIECLRLPQRILDEKNKCSLKLFLFLPYLIYISYSLMGWFAIFGELSIINCKISHRIATLCYASAKCWLYQFFYSKLYVIYSNSFYSFKLRCFVAISILIAVYIGITTLIILTKHESIQLDHGCISRVPFYLYAIQVILDQFVSFLALYLFIKPLKELVIIQHKNSNQIGIGRFKTTIIKNATLVSVAVFSSFSILIIIAIFGGTAFGHIDGVVNCLCVALMHSWKFYGYIYESVCCFPIFIVQKYCYKWFVYNSKQDNAPKIVLENTESAASVPHENTALHIDDT